MRQSIYVSLTGEIECVHGSSSIHFKDILFISSKFETKFIVDWKIKKTGFKVAMKNAKDKVIH